MQPQWGEFSGGITRRSHGLASDFPFCLHVRGGLPIFTRDMLSRTNHFPVQGRVQSFSHTSNPQSSQFSSQGEAKDWVKPSQSTSPKRERISSSSRAPNRNSKLQWKKSRSVCYPRVKCVDDRAHVFLRSRALLPRWLTRRLTGKRGGCLFHVIRFLILLFAVLVQFFYRHT